MTGNDPAAPDGTVWYTETLHEGYRASIEVRRTLFEGRSGRQHMVIADSVRFGTLVMRDGVTQNGVPFFQAAELEGTMRAFSRLFADSTCYLAAVPTYIGGFMAFGWGTDDAALRKVPLETLEDRLAASGIATRYYTPEVHQASFALPRFILDIVERARGG